MGAAAGFRRLAHSFSELLSEQVKLPMILVQRRGSIGMTKGPNGWDFDPIKTCHKSEREWDWRSGAACFGGTQYLVFERTTKGTAQWTRFADLSEVASGWLERSSRDIQRLCWSDLWEGQRGNLIPDHLTGTWGWCTTLFEIAAAGRLLPEVRLRTELSDTAKLWRQVTELEIVMGTKLEYLRPILQLHRSALPHELGDTLISHLDDLVIASVVGSEYLAELCDAPAKIESPVELSTANGVSAESAPDAAPTPKAEPLKLHGECEGNIAEVVRKIRATGISLRAAALLFTDGDEKAATNTIRRWHNSRSPQLPPSIGFDPLHSQTKLYPPSAILQFAQIVEGFSDVDFSGHLAALNAKARCPRPVAKPSEPSAR